MIVLDGSSGEGGGQILRSSLALSLVTGRPFRIENIRARRDKPGLQRQHLMAVNAAAKVGGATVTGAAVGSREITFAPGGVAPGDYTFAIATAGSTTLVFQTVLPALVSAGGPSTLVFEGGTHNHMAPTFDFIAETFVPLVNRMGPRVQVELERFGFYPGGGGRFVATVEPAPLGRLDLRERGAIRRVTGQALVVKLPVGIAERELDVLGRELGLEAEDLLAEERDEAYGPGNVVSVRIEGDHVTELVTSLGARGVRAETVAERAAAEARTLLDAGVPVGEHLADQLLLPMALAGGGSFATVPLSLHSTTNSEVIKRFLEVEIVAEDRPDGTCLVEVSA
jgi:RNA 3'-terminal phosphate cyclase (ATP)